MQEELTGLLKQMGIQNPDLKPQTHNLTVGQMKEVREKQARRETFPTITPSNKAVAEKYPQFKVYEKEKHLVHVILEIVNFTEKGKKTSKPFMQTFYPEDFQAMQKSTLNKGDTKRPRNAFGEYDVVEILHNPANMVIEKPEPSIDKLRAEFLELTGVAAPEDFTVAELASFIAEQHAKGQ